MRTKSKLEVISYSGKNDIRHLVDSLIDHCPLLNTFIDFHLYNPYHWRRATAAIFDEMKHRYDFLCQFNGLKVIGLTSYTQCGSDLYYPLLRLAAQKTTAAAAAAKIEELKIMIDRDEALVLAQPIHCTVHTEHSIV